MDLTTSASFISYVSKIEQGSSDFYERCMGQHVEFTGIFDLFIEENKKSEKNIRRAYYSVVSDALETNFCFKGLEDDVEIPVLKHGASLFEILKMCIELEKNIQGFYQKATDLSMALLADVSRAKSLHEMLVCRNF